MASISISAFILPPRSASWNSNPTSTTPCLPCPPSIYVNGDAYEMWTPLALDQVPCPVDAGNRDSWTGEERDKAEKRINAQDLTHLQNLVSSSHPLSLLLLIFLIQLNHHHEDGKRALDTPYIGVPSAILGE